MAVTGINLGNTGLLFVRFEKAIARTLQDEAKAFNMAKKDMNWEGDYIEFKVHVTRNNAFQFSEDGGAMPTTAGQGYVPARIGRRFTHAKLKLTDGAMAAAKGGANSAKSVVTSEVQGVMKDLVKWYNYLFYGDGTGVVSTVKNVGSTSGSNTVNVQVDDGRVLGFLGSFDVYDTTLTTNRGTVTISDVQQRLNSSGYALVDCTGLVPSGTIATDKIVWKNSLNRAFTGLAGLVDDSSTTFQNVNTSTYPRYTSYVLDNSGTNRLITPTIFRTMLAGLKQKTGNDRPSEGLTCFSDSWQQTSFEEMYESEYRFTNENGGAVGVEGVTFNSALGKITLVNDTDCTRHKMYCVDTGQLHHAIQKELGFRPGSDGVFTPSQEAGFYSATMIGISQMYISERHSSARIDDLSDAATISF